MDDPTHRVERTLRAAALLIDAHDCTLDARGSKLLELSCQVLRRPEADDLQQPALARACVNQLEVGEHQRVTDHHRPRFAHHLP
jgi:hypothetical protein